MTTTPNSLTYKDNIVHRMGGMAHYEMSILEFCDGLRKDKELRQFYGNFDIGSLLMFQRQTLDWALREFETNREEEQAGNRVRLHHYRLLQNGFSNKHVDAVCQQFVEALRHSWVDEDVTEIAAKHLQCLHRFIDATPGAEKQAPSSSQGGPIERVLDEENDDDDDSVSSFFSWGSVEAGSVPTSPIALPISTPDSLRKGKMGARRRRSSTKDKLASLFQNLRFPQQHASR